MATLSPPTLQRLITEARIFLNQRSPENSFWKDDELTGYINDAIRQYFLVISENAEGQFDRTATLDLVANVETVDLPTDLYEVRALYKTDSDGQWMLQYRNNLTDGYVTNTGTSGPGYRPYYYFRGNSLVLRPIPGGNETAGLLLEYTAFPETLITGQDALTSKISPVFKELVVKYCCYQAKLKESSVNGGNTYAPVEAHLADLFQNFKQAVAGRSKYPQFIKPFLP